MASYSSLSQAVERSIAQLKQYGIEVDPGHWQGVTTEGKPELVTKEIINLQWDAPMPLDAMDLADQLSPNLPWAEDHFLERVSRVPSNPGEEYKNWPWWRGQEGATRIPSEKYEEHQSEDFKFTHTYQERFWPKQAGGINSPATRSGGAPLRDLGAGAHFWNGGIRYGYGDLDDVIELLRREPQTRQATFPIFFPEDTGAVHGGRIPCTLHYHFLLRRNKLHLWYPIRSCDAVRHFRDDLYMAVRLCHWVIAELVEYELRHDVPQEWVDVEPGWLHFTAYSFHVHKGDMHLL